MVLVEIINWIVNFISATGYAGVFFLMALESANIPVPSEVIMPFAGYLVFLKKFGFIEMVLAGALGNLFGSIISYYIGLKGGRPFIDRYGKYLFLHKKDMGLAERWFQKYGELTIFFSRVLPVVRTFISVPAGIGEMDVKKFIAYTFIGSLIWSAVLAYIGFSLGPNWNSILGFFQQFEIIIIAVGVIVAAVYFWRTRR